MVQIGVGTALRVHRLRVGGELASGGGGHVDDGDDRVHRARIANLGPVEGLHQRFGQGQSGSLDQDVVDLGPALDELAHHRVELFLHRATQAAVGQFIELPRALAAVLVATDAAAAQNFAIDAELAELIDDDSDTPAFGVGEDVAQQCGLAAAEEASNDGGGDAGCGRHGVLLRRRSCAGGEVGEVRSGSGLAWRWR